ncbi:allatostatin-A receptor-like [Hemicordylus capensis]|uniref:allatostatin-A receptor-like n=1 Tax=Hemicordylus capensis TaxID=884348 RepID=UPI0023043B8C|nr:allatostatin-A receptor-like [Hemicordylus capensis]
MYINYVLVYSCVFGLILLTGFSANALALVLSIKYSSLKKNQLDVLLLSMVVADLLTLVLMPFVLASVIHYTWLWGDAFCKFFQFCSAFSLAASIYSLCAVSIARARIILRPYKTPKTTIAIFMLILVWVLSAVISLPLRIHATMETRFSTNLSFCLPTLYQQHYQVILSQFILYYLIPVLVIASNYVQLILFLQKSPMMSVLSSRNTRRASIMICIATATFSVCWLPLYILELCIYLRIYHHGYIWDSFYFVCNILQYLHPCVNPVLYVLLSKRYRNQKRKLLCCKKSRVHPQIHSIMESREGVYT